uniref:hypothetical chloroplast RF66 n=1 Tax=Klebsormidium dissectum TaxID=329816 RepID=UPI00286D3D7A|nr:hypothetical chloroplast RF66 [Klebsormidium dissectum]WKT06516.1 hypothetical chloroplast RF66 [Klebsormidium dissectum]
MINLDFNASILLGVCLIGTSIALYAIRKINPELSRDSDIIFSTIGIAAGSILTFQGWRLDPILLFCQTCSTGVALFFVWESVRLRQDSHYLNNNKNLLNIQKKNLSMWQGWRLPSKPKDRKIEKNKYMFVQIQPKNTFTSHFFPIQPMKGRK